MAFIGHPVIKMIHVHHPGSVSKDTPTSSQSGSTTETQESDIKLLAELVSNENSDEVASNEDKDDDVNLTWLPSSGFCVVKDNQLQKV